MTTFWEGAEKMPVTGNISTRNYEGKIAALLSQNYREIFRHFANENPSLPESYHRFQLVTDYICGMTDSFALRLHRELTNGA
jgi:dGTPase